MVLQLCQVCVFGCLTVPCLVLFECSSKPLCEHDRACQFLPLTRPDPYLSRVEQHGVTSRTVSLQPHTNPPHSLMRAYRRAYAANAAVLAHACCRHGVRRCLWCICSCLYSCLRRRRTWPSCSNAFEGVQSSSPLTPCTSTRPPTLPLLPRRGPRPTPRCGTRR